MEREVMLWKFEKSIKNFSSKKGSLVQIHRHYHTFLQLRTKNQMQQRKREFNSDIPKTPNSEKDLNLSDTLKGGLEMRVLCKAFARSCRAARIHSKTPNMIVRSHVAATVIKDGKIKRTCSSTNGSHAEISALSDPSLWTNTHQHFQTEPIHLHQPEQ